MVSFLRPICDPVHGDYANSNANEGQGRTRWADQMTDNISRMYARPHRDDRVAQTRKLNAVSDEVVHQLMAAFRRFDADPDAYVAILRGHGRALCSDADVHQRQLRSREVFERLGGAQG
jgi:hypothetical protein